MKAHIGADVESGLVHHVHGTAVNVADVPQVAELLHGDENAIYADGGYTGAERREDRDVTWQIAACRSTYLKFGKCSLIYKIKRKIEYCKAHARAKVEHPIRVVKRQFGYVKVRFRGLAKSPASQPHRQVVSGFGAAVHPKLPRYEGVRRGISGWDSMTQPLHCVVQGPTDVAQYRLRSRQVGLRWQNPVDVGRFCAVIDHRVGLETLLWRDLIAD